MWKQLVPVIAVFLATAGSLAGKSPAAREVGREEVRQAIKIFQRDPLGVQGSMARPLILTYAQDSAEVEVILAPKLLPWVTDKALTEEEGGALITAYCAGAIESQLNGGQAHSTALAAACEQVIATYHQLQRKRPPLKSPGVEKLIALARQHQLADYLAAAEREKPSPRARPR